MISKLKKIKAKSQQLGSEISSDLRRSAAELEKVAKPPFKNLGEFDSWFNSDKPLTL